MKKLYLPAVFLLILGLVLGGFGCAKPAPAPAPAPAPKPAPAPAPKPVTVIKIYGAAVGDPWYTLSEALAYYINHESEWLRATVVSGPGMHAGYDLVMEDPEHMAWVAEMSGFYYIPKKPWGERWNYYDKTRFIGISATIPMAWVTFDKDIKTWQDLAGKKVMIARKGSVLVNDDEAVLEAWGVKDKVDISNGTWGPMMTALRDGLVDTAVLGLDLVYPAGWAKGAFITELETRGPIYYLSHDPDMLDKLKKEGRFSGIPVRVPPGRLDRKTQPTELWVHSNPAFFAADERMDEDIVYEVTRVLYETAGPGWATWHRQGGHMTKEWIPASPVPLEFIHPGAKKYYDEHGIKVKILSDMLR